MEWLENAQRLVIITNNSCNLKCPRCDTGCDNPWGEHPWRESPWEVNLESVRLLLDKIGEHIPVIRLHGGETTCMSMDKLKALIDLIASYNIPVGILTNGYNILGLGEHLEKLDHIVINGHGINEIWLDEIEPILRKLENPKIYRLGRYDYYDMHSVMHNSPKTRETCVLYKKIVGFYKDTLHPCCGPYYCHEDVGKDMIGWNVYDEDFVETVKSLDNLPKRFWDICYDMCAFNATEQPTIDIREGVRGSPSYQWEER